MSEFQSQEEALHAYVRNVVEAQIRENPALVHNLQELYQYNLAQIYQILQQQHAPQSQDSDFDMLEEGGSQPEKIRKEKHIEEPVTKDPDEFDTEEEAQQYALAVSLELFDDIISEFIAENNARGVLDIDPARKVEICQSDVLPYVWQAMSVT